jgi:hypothetical protein
MNECGFFVCVQDPAKTISLAKGEKNKGMAELSLAKDG